MIVVLIIVAAAALYAMRHVSADPVPKEQCDKARAFVAALDTASIDYEKVERAERKRARSGDARRANAKHSKSNGASAKPAPRGGGSDLRPMDRIEN